MDSMDSMDADERARGAHRNDDFEAEVTDLDPATDLFRRFKLWSARSLTGRSLTPGQRVARAASGVVAVLVAVLIVFFSTQRYSAASTAVRSAVPVGQQPRLRQDGLGCLADAEWAPDGRRLAMIGTQQDCQQNGPNDYVITLYDANSGKITSRLWPDTPVLAALHAVAPYADTHSDGSIASPVLYYSAVLWSHDARRLALPFYLQLAPRDGSLQFEGMLVLNVDGSHPRALLRRLTGQGDAVEWDLTTGKPLSPVAGQPTLLPFESVTPAESYTWGWGGTLVPDTRLDAEAVPAPDAGPVGAPGGGDVFTLWQPGGVARQTETAGGQTYHIYTWGVTFAAWSPDGRYLVDAISQIERLVPQDEPKPSAEALATLGAADMPLLPVRDAGLRAVLLRLTHDTPGPGPQVAWRPDGRILAVYGIGPNVSIYDCATGRLLASLPPSMTPNGTPATGSLDLLRWSPDGSHLLFVGLSLHAVSIWGPGQLPL